MVVLLFIKAKYITAAKTTKEVIWIAYFFKELKISCNIYFLIQFYCSSQKAIGLSKNSKDYKRTKYINICYYFIQEK